MQSTEIKTLTIDAPVTTVTLLEDRAQVQRIGKANLTAGLWRVNADRVAPVLSDKSLRAEFTGDINARVNDVRVRRQMLIKESDRSGLVEELKREWRSQYDQYQVLTEDRQYLEEQFEQIGTILAKALQELPIDAAWGQVDPMAWRSQLQQIFQRLRDIRSEILNTYHAQTQLREAIALITQRRPITTLNLVTRLALLDICHAIGTCHIAHGLANVLMITHVIRYKATDVPFNQATFSQNKYPNSKWRYAQIANYLNLGGDTDDEKVELLIAAVEDLKRQVD